MGVRAGVTQWKETTPRRAPHEAGRQGAATASRIERKEARRKQRSNGSLIADEGDHSMTRKRFVGLLGVVAAAVVGGSMVMATNPLRAADEKQDAAGQHKKHDEAAMAACIDACHKCLKECESCFRHCSNHVAMGHKTHEASMRHCIDCAEFCAMCARVCGRGGPLGGHAAHACKEACEACAKACEQGDERMKKCAAVCHECAKACAAVASH